MFSSFQYFGYHACFTGAPSNVLITQNFPSEVVL